MFSNIVKSFATIATLSSITIGASPVDPSSNDVPLFDPSTYDPSLFDPSLFDPSTFEGLLFDPLSDDVSTIKRRSTPDSIPQLHLVHHQDHYDCHAFAYDTPSWEEKNLYCSLKERFIEIDVDYYPNSYCPSYTTPFIGINDWNIIRPWGNWHFDGDFLNLLLKCHDLGSRCGGLNYNSYDGFTLRAYAPLQATPSFFEWCMVIKDVRVGVWKGTWEKSDLRGDALKQSPPPNPTFPNSFL